MRGSSQGGVACIGEGTLAAFAEGQIDEHLHGRIEEHLADCAECRAVFKRAAGVIRSGAQGSGIFVDAGGSQELVPGTRVGRYVVENEIGRGAMGAVYLATDPDLDRRVAVKLLRADMWSDAARGLMRARLLREAQAMARLSHPEVITVYDVGAFGDQLFVAMEYVDGQTLRRWRADRHRTYAEILAVYERAGSGLAAAHEAGLVHRDFKPDNVLVGRDGRVRVTDFGLARTLADARAPNRPIAAHVDTSMEDGLTVSLTRTGTLLGTPAYMAPEQLRGGAADARSDVFSYCTALYEALYGERPFRGSTISVLMTAIDAGAIRAAPLMTRVPRWVRAVLLRGLRATPEHRFASMRDLLDTLRSAHSTSWRRGGIAFGVVAVALGIGAAVAVTKSATGVGNGGHEGGQSSAAMEYAIATRVVTPTAIAMATATPTTIPLSTATPNTTSGAIAHARSTPERRTDVPWAPASAAQSAPRRRIPPMGHNGAPILE